MSDLVAAPSNLRMLTVEAMAKTPPWCNYYSRSGYRHLVFNAKPITDSSGRIVVPGNGLLEAGVIIRIGRKVFFDLSRFDEWLTAHRVTG
ncbi:MAG: hypothetical protein IT566_01465 [Rhodospirillaceae bacterium]|nr:hypothetical protein [Rhodospirillaceae bacterium]